MISFTRIETYTFRTIYRVKLLASEQFFMSELSIRPDTYNVMSGIQTGLFDLI